MIRNALLVFLLAEEGAAEPIARIPLAEWDNLIKTGTPVKQ